MSNSTNNESEEKRYGHLDTSYKAAGKEPGLRKLSQDFYQIMSTLPEAKTILDMHNEDFTVMVEKLTLFLSMWLGGPRTYREKNIGKGMPAAHSHLIINEKERDAWLLCMDQAVDQQNFPEDFKIYLKEQFRTPAEMIRRTSRFS